MTTQTTRSLHLSLALALLTAQALADTHTALVVYPEYPAAIERDYAYAVSVTQGATTTNLVVYNHCQKSALTQRTRGGDVNRRFCEFAFSGAPVRVDIRVCEDVQSYKVFPSRLGLETSFANGVISVWLDEPHSFGIELNDYVKTILSVLVDEPEDPTDVPSPGDPGVLYVDDWMDPPGIDGVVLVSNNWSEVYIAPGAVLNARLYVHSPDVHVHGRGMILDPFSDIFRFDQLDNTRSGVLWVNANGKRILVEDIKIVDARQYNFWTFAEDITLRNVKALSSMMCSDGITSSGKNYTVDRAWLYVGDNALVVSGNKDGTLFRDITIGTSCKAIFPQGDNTGVTMEDIDVFRADEALIANVYNPKSTTGLERTQSFFFRNLSGVDSTLFARFFDGAKMGTLPKTFGFENLAIPHSTGAVEWHTIGRSGGQTIRIYDGNGDAYETRNYTLAITNLWIAGARSYGFDESEIKNPDRVALSVTNTLATPPFPVVPNRHVVNWTCPYKRYIGDSIQRDIRFTTPATGEQRLAEPNMRANLLADRPATRSNWQRSPSYQAKLDATTFDPADGARIYRVRDSLANAGMYCDITDGFLRRGNGTWRLSFDARINVTNGTPPVIQAKLLSNEKTRIFSFPLANDSDWTRCTVDINTDFDLSETTTVVGLNRVTELVGLQLISTNATQRMEFKNLSFLKHVEQLEIADADGFDWTNRVVTVSGLFADSPITLAVTTSDGTPVATLAATTDAEGEATFNVPTTPGVAYAYTVTRNGQTLGVNSSVAGAWDADGAWFLAAPDGQGGSTEVGGVWTLPPTATNAASYVVEKASAFALDADAHAAGSNQLVRAEGGVVYRNFCSADDLAELTITDTLAAFTPVWDPEAGGEPTWMAYVDGGWTALQGAPAPAFNVPYVVRMEGDFTLPSPRVRFAVSADGGATFAPLAAATGAQWLVPSDAVIRALSEVATDGTGEIAGFRGELASAAVAVSTNGVGYASLEEALMADGDVTLLTNATWPTNAPAGTVSVNRGGFTLLQGGVEVQGESVVVSAGICAVPSAGTLRVNFTDLAGVGVATEGRTPAQIAADLAADGANGIPRWQSYVLGLDATDPEALPLANIVLGDEGDTVAVSDVGITVNESAGATVTCQVIEVKDLSDPSQNEPVGEPVAPGEPVVIDMDGSGTQFFRINVKITLP